MPCVPAITPSLTRAKASDAFTFSPAEGVACRSWQNLTALWTMPWVAYWAVTLEALNPENYRR